MIRKRHAANITNHIRTCENCGEFYTTRPAMSRTNPQKTLCPMCGVREALKAANFADENITEILNDINEYVQNTRVAIEWHETKRENNLLIYKLTFDPYLNGNKLVIAVLEITKTDGQIQAAVTYAKLHASDCEKPEITVEFEPKLNNTSNVHTLDKKNSLINLIDIKHTQKQTIELVAKDFLKIANTYQYMYEQLAKHGLFYNIADNERADENAD